MNARALERLSPSAACGVRGASCACYQPQYGVSDGRMVGLEA
jgi:hypothetical protein